MARFGWLVLVALMFAGACMDDAKNPAVERAESPLAPAAIAAPSVTSNSTVCRAYLRDLDDVKRQMVREPMNTELANSAEALGAIITDACN